MVTGRSKKKKKKKTPFPPEENIERPITHTLIFFILRAACQRRLVLLVNVFMIRACVCSLAFDIRLAT